MDLQNIEEKIRDKMLKKYGDRCKGKKDFFLLKTKGLYKNKTVSFLNLIIKDSPVVDISAETYSECFSSLLEIINNDRTQSKAEIILELFGYTSDKPIPTNPEDTYFYMIIFDLIEESLKRRGGNPKEITLSYIVENLTRDELLSFKMARGKNTENTRNYIRVIVNDAIEKCKRYPANKL